MVFGDDKIGHTQAQPGSPIVGFGGKKGFKNATACGCVHAWSVVLNPYTYPTFIALMGQSENESCKIQQVLLNILRNGAESMHVAMTGDKE